ncbi:ribonuclease H-like domain-containing protein, partial [Tanacetum coccineum]
LSGYAPIYFRILCFLGDNLLTWSSKRQDTLSRSSAEAEYRGIANAVAETSWIRNLFRELHTLLFTAILVYCDNVSAVYMSDIIFNGLAIIRFKILKESKRASSAECTPVKGL